MFSKQNPDQTKSCIISTLLTGTIAVDVDPSKADVPAQFKRDASVRLNLSLQFPGPISVNNDAVHARLSFGGRAYNCVIPWDAIDGIILLNARTCLQA